MFILSLHDKEQYKLDLQFNKTSLGPCTCRLKSQLYLKYLCIIQSQTFNVILKQMNLMTYKSDTKFYLLVAPLFQSCLHHHQQTLHAENKNILIFCFCLEYLLSTSCHQCCRKLSCPFTQEKDFKFHHKYSLFRVLFNLHFKKLQIEIIAEKLWNSWSI